MIDFPVLPFTPLPSWPVYSINMVVTVVSCQFRVPKYSFELFTYFIPKGRCMSLSKSWLFLILRPHSFLSSELFRLFGMDRDDCSAFICTIASVLGCSSFNLSGKQTHLLRFSLSLPHVYNNISSSPLLLQSPLCTKIFVHSVQLNYTCVFVSVIIWTCILSLYLKYLGLYFSVNNVL